MAEQFERLKQKMEPILNSSKVQLYEISWQGSGKDRTLQVAIMHSDGSMDLDTCAEVSEKLSALLDAEEGFKEPYTLEVCSPGAEREIRDLKELEGMPGAYIHIRLKKPAGKLLETDGTILAADADGIRLQYRDKAVNRTADIKLDNIDAARMAVKL